MNLNIFRKPIPDTDIGAEAARALAVIRLRLRNYGVLLAAVKAATGDREDDARLAAFAEDYGLDQIDPIRRIDVLRHALKIVGSND